MKVWVVFGSTGEYSDRREWPVAAFFHVGTAQDRIRDCENWLLEHGCSRAASGDIDRPENYYDRHDFRDELERNPFDDQIGNHGIDPCGVRYYHVEVPGVGDMPPPEVVEEWGRKSRAVRLRD